MSVLRASSRHAVNVQEPKPKATAFRPRRGLQTTCSIPAPHQSSARVASSGPATSQGLKLQASAAAQATSLAATSTLRLRGQAEEKLVQIIHGFISGAQDMLQQQGESTAVRLAAQESEVVMSLRAELEQAKAKANEYMAQAQRVNSTECMNRALQHSNFNLTRQLREERVERSQLKLRLERLKAGCSVASDVSCDPAMERQVLQMVKSDEMHTMEMQIADLRHEVMLLHAQLDGKQV